MKSKLDIIENQRRLQRERVPGIEKADFPIDYDLRKEQDLFLSGCMDEFAAQEKQKLAQELVNAFVKKNPMMDKHSFAEFLNFEALKHLFPQISFEDGGNQINVIVKE